MTLSNVLEQRAWKQHAPKGQPGIHLDTGFHQVHTDLASTPLFMYLHIYGCTSVRIYVYMRICMCVYARVSKTQRTEVREEKLRRSCAHPRAGASPRRAKPEPVPDSPVVRSRASWLFVPVWPAFLWPFGFCSLSVSTD